MLGKMPLFRLAFSGYDGPMPQTREHILLARQVGVFGSSEDRTRRAEAREGGTVSVIGEGGQEKAVAQNTESISTWNLRCAVRTT